MRKKIIPIKGMHCRSCELLIEEELKKLPSVYFIGVSFKKGQAEIHSHNEVPNDLIYKAVAEAGYSVGKNEVKEWFTKDPKKYEELFSAFIILVAVYLILKMFGLTDIKPNFGEPSSLLVVLLIGLTAGISTCMALVGGLIVGISARHAEKHPEADAVQKFRPHIFFNLGRIGSYAVLGGLIGLIGKAFQFSGPSLGLITLVVALIMLLMGLQLIEIFPKLSGISISIPASISKFFGIKQHHQKEYSHSNSAMIGALTFFLPCGFTQAMQIYAMSTGSFITGALIMGVFALGTAPGLLGIGGLTSVVKGSFSKKFFKFVGLVVISLALFNLSNAFNLLDIKLSLPASQNQQNGIISSDPNVTIEDGKQVVRMTEDSFGYKPNSFVIKKGIPVKWIIDAKNIYSCASSLVSRDLKLSTTLKSGENVFEFTPSETGTISFSCSMGMYRGSFTVIDDSGSIPVENRGASPTPDPETPKPVTQNSGDTQILKTTYISNTKDIYPNEFKVKVGKPVEFTIDVNENGSGCMSTIMIPGLVDQPQLLQKGQPIKMSFTPKNKGSYLITCAMGVPRGEIIAE
jgi:sulfite exporter TauE/SafE/copper chaperone CopZ